MDSNTKQNEPEILGAEFVRNHFPNRIPDSSKGTFGKVLNIAGCQDYSGAAYLSSLSPLKIGAGLVVLASCSATVNNVSSNTPDVVKEIINRGNHIRDRFSLWFKKYDISGFQAISIGCGLGQSKSTVNFLTRFVNKAQNLDTPIVYDADALNIIAKTNLTRLGKNVILTPHPAEMARLLRLTVKDVQSNRLYCAKKAAEKYSATVVLKGHNTLIATPDGKVYLDQTGTQILAKAGMGDVLAGMIAGLCAQGVQPKIAAALGVHLHSCAGEVAKLAHLSLFENADEFAQNASTASLLASELLGFIKDGIAYSVK